MKLVNYLLFSTVLFLVAPAHAGEPDPHAHHKKMMSSSSGYERSVHGYELGGVPVMTAQGVESTLESIMAGDKTVMVHFIFTTCTTICPVQAATFAQVQTKLGDAASDVQMVSISIDPEYDTPSRLLDYSQKFRAGPQWVFLTGTAADMIQAQRVFNAYEGGKMNHKPLTLLRAAGTDEWVRLDGLVNASDIMNEYEALKAGS